MKDITLVAIDFVSHDLTARAIELCLQTIDPREVVVISDREFMPGVRTVIQPAPNGMPEVANIMLKGVAEHVETRHALYVQWDGIAWRPEKWDTNFLNYDYIGAPWPWRPEGSNVGNGGFSLRSKRLLDICATDPAITLTSGEPIAEDNIIGQLKRGYLETQGIKFAPTELAMQFSYELGDYRESFGFHGLWNIVNNLPEQEIDYFLAHMSYRGWNIHKWNHFLQALLKRGLFDHVAFAVEQCEKHNPEHLAILAQWIKI